MGRRIIGFFLPLFFSAPLSVLAPAFADNTPVSLVRVTCSSRADYLSVETLTLETSDGVYSDDTNGLFSLNDLKSKPFDCKINNHVVRISVPSILGAECDESGCDDEHGGRVPCAAREDGHLEVTVDGVSIVQIASTHRYACGLEGRFRVEVSRFGYMFCKMQGEGIIAESEKAVDMVCSRKPFKTPL